MPKIKRFIECLTPVTACNLRCEYCYVIQEGRRANEIQDLHYSPQHIRKALSQKRLGGVCYISLCGAGETLLPKYMTELIRELLEEGHYVNVTNNGTITQRIDELCALDKELLKRLHFAFSFHYVELKRKNLIDTFFNNVQKVKESGCSFLVQINLYDGYLEHLDEIKRICVERVGAMPQVAATRDESDNTYKLLTKLSTEEYEAAGKSFASPLFDFTMKNFMVKREEFCYAGDWSFLLNMQTGMMTKCYRCSSGGVNIFSDPSKRIPFEAIGYNCQQLYCVNSSHFMSLGIIPEISCPSYADLRNREVVAWYTPAMREFLSGKLGENNKQYSEWKKRRLTKRQARGTWKERLYKTKFYQWLHSVKEKLRG